MQRIVQSLSCLLLALALALSGPGIAGPAKGAILVDLCAGDTPAQIWLDAEGNPVDPGDDHVKCLDCLLFSAPLPAAADGLLTPAPLGLPAGLAQSANPPTRPLAHLRPLPRGPPAAARAGLRHGQPRPVTRPPHPSHHLAHDTHQATAKVPPVAPRATS